MKLGKIALDLECFTGANDDEKDDGNNVIAVGAHLAQPYTGGKPDKLKPAVQKVDVVFPKNSYEALTVTVANPNPELEEIIGATKVPVYVRFKEFSAKLYTMSGKTDVSARAKSIEIVMDEFDLAV